MNPQVLFTFLLPLIRHSLVAYGVVELGKADEASGQIAGAICTLIGFVWSLWNANQAKKAKEEAKKAE